MHNKPRTDKETHDFIDQNWGLGFVDKKTARVKKSSAFRYAAKYAVKDGLYQWSRRPTIGHEGVRLWRNLVLRKFDAEKDLEGFSLETFKVPGFIQLNVLGHGERIGIPSQDYIAVYRDLGVMKSPDVRLGLQGVPNGPLSEHAQTAIKARLDGEK